MNNKLTFTGGEPNMNEDDFLRIQKANQRFIHNMFADFGDCIIEGCRSNISGGDIDLESGYILLDGEVLRVSGGIVSGTGKAYWQFEKSTTYDTGGDKTFLDGTPRQTWEINRAFPVNVDTVTTLNIEEAERLFPSETWITPTLTTNWGNTDLQYKRDKRGIVHISGRVTRFSASSKVAFTLPEGHRPSKDLYFGAVTEGSSPIPTNFKVLQTGDFEIGNSNIGDFIIDIRFE